MKSFQKTNAPLRPETILFVGAGATACLRMPTTDDQAGILWHLCDKEELSAQDVEKAASSSHCFDARGGEIVDLLRVVDSGWRGTDEPILARELQDRAFPDIADADVRLVVRRLREHYDWSALKLIARMKKNDGWGEVDGRPRENYLQEVFTLIDASLREERGFDVFHGDEKIFLSVARLRAARELLILLINTMFACAWSRLVAPGGDRSPLEPYRRFFDALAVLQQKEGQELDRAGTPLDDEAFYKFHYSIITLNFEPIFLWLIWQGHKHANKRREVRVGNPTRRLALRMNFPTTVGMRKPAEPNEEPSAKNWFPCTEAGAQIANNCGYLGERVFRVGMYAPVHGMSNFRHCPVCGRLNLYLGDTWDEDSSTLFPNGVTAGLLTGQQPRTNREKQAHKHGEYDALECHFCGALTHAYDNFMFMQTQLKCAAPSFIKEMTDDALAQISGTKHLVLLGYSLPLDDAIWGSVLTMMTRRAGQEKVYCSLVAYAPDAPKGWIAGKELDKFLDARGTLVKDKEDVRAIRNVIAVFGKDCVRAYMAGVPSVFGDGSEEDVRKLLYPTKDETGWNLVFTRR